MITILALQRRLNISKNRKGPEVLNHAIRLLVPGGTEVLDTLTRLHEMQHNRPRPRDPALEDMIVDLVRARDKMADSILEGKYEIPR